MATPEQRSEALDAARRILHDLAKVEAKSLGREQELGPQINFEDIVPDLDMILQPFRDLEGRDVGGLSHVDLSGITKHAEQVRDIIKDIQSFSVTTQANPGSAAAQLKQRVREAYDAVAHGLLRQLVFTATQERNYAKMEREAEGLLSRVRRSADEFKSLLDERGDQIAQAMEAIKQQAAEAGVSQNAIHFRAQADAYAKKACVWRNATICLAVGTGLTAVGFLALAFVYTPESAAAAIQFSVAKLLVVSVLTLSLVWCARNHRAMRHNETLDRHRQNALATFRAFVEGTDSEPVRDAVLLAATSAAFSLRSTGYVTNEDDGDHSALLALDAASRMMPRPSLSVGTQAS